MICLDLKKDKDAEILLNYATGLLAPAQVLELEQHAGHCSSCAKLLTAQREVWTALDTFSVPDVSVNFDQLLYARIAAEQQQALWARWWKRWFVEFPAWKPALAGAVACAVLAVGLTVRAPHADNSTKQASIDNDIEQVEQVLEDLEMLTPQASSSRM